MTGRQATRLGLLAGASGRRPRRPALPGEGRRLRVLGRLAPGFANRVGVGAAADYFFDVRWRAITTALLFNAFPVERYRSRRLRSLAAELVDDGWSLLLYPEGTRSEDGWMNPFRVGAAHLCVAKALPVVPIAISGSYAAMPPRPRRPLPRHPRLPPPSRP